MSRGVYYTKHFDETLLRGVYEQPVPNYNFLYQPSSTKLAEFNVGDRVELPDGRVFRYSKLGGAITSARVDYGVYFAAGSRNKWYENPSQGQNTGDMYIVLPFDEAGSTSNRSATSTTVTVDELRGGYIVIYKDGVANQCVRGIMGNDASDSASPYNTKIYLDAPLPYAVVVADGVELISNPWADVRSMFADNTTAVTMCGMPTVVAASGDYTFIQTWGPCRVSLVTPSVYERSVYVGANGSCVGRDDLSTNMDQCIGTLILPTIYQSAFINLQISP